MYKSEEKILHVMWTNAPHLNGPLSQKMMRCFPNGKICMWDVYPIPADTEEGRTNDELNRQWLSKLPQGVYEGVLWQSFVIRHRKAVVRTLSHLGRIGDYMTQFVYLFFPDISFASILRLASLPGKILMHGRVFSTGTIFALSLLGKKIVYIHWGGPVSYPQNCFSAKICRFAFRLCKQVFTLMKPEERMFEYVTTGRVKTLPYAYAGWEGVAYDEQNTIRNLDSHQILLGNNAYDFCSAGYKPIVEKLDLSEWDRITAMFNYGKGHCDSDGHITKRIKELEEICGHKFFPWITTVPYDEYLRIVNSSAFYFCPAIIHSGLGAISTSIRQGKAIFLRGLNYEWIRYLGITAYNLDEVKDFSYASLRSYIPDVETARRNYNIIKDVSYSQAAQDRWVRSIEGAFK